MNNRKSKTAFLTKSAVIAALYVVLTEISAILGISSGVIQFRLSEMFAVLPIFTPAAIPGLFIGGLISNILAGGIFIPIFAIKKVIKITNAEESKKQANTTSINLKVTDLFCFLSILNPTVA